MHVPEKIQPRLVVFTLSIIGVMLGSSPSSARAEAPPLPLPAAERLALKHNPALKAAEKNAEAMTAIPSQAGSLPDPTISLNALNLPVDSFSVTQENMTQIQLGISQALPFPGKLALKERLARLSADAAKHQYQEFRLMLLRNVRIHWWNLAYLDKALEIIHRNQDLLRNLIRIAETRYKTGKGLQQDVLLAQLELSKLLERGLSLQAARDRESATLNALLGRPADQPIILPRLNPGDARFVEADPALLKQWAREHRPLLLAMDDHVQAAEARLALAEKDYYPDFKLVAAYGIRSGVNPMNRQSRPDFASVMLSMSVPLYAGRKQDKAVDQRMAEKARAEFSWQDAANQIDAEIDTAASELRAARRKIALYEKGMLPQARQTTASMLAGYQVNKVDFLNLIRAQINEYNTELQYWRQIAQAHQAEARLAAASGMENLGKEVVHHEKP